MSFVNLFNKKRLFIYKNIYKIVTKIRKIIEKIVISCYNFYYSTKTANKKVTINETKNQ